MQRCRHFRDFILGTPVTRCNEKMVSLASGVAAFSGIGVPQRQHHPAPQTKSTSVPANRPANNMQPPIDAETPVYRSIRFAEWPTTW
ncbi:unnamed protein product [Ectocarpus sp. 12 AP-2014]